MSDNYVSWSSSSGQSFKGSRIVDGNIGPQGDPGEKGEQGYSAYEIAVQKGFVGTEEEWIKSLEGKSAYEVAVENGYEGTEEDWTNEHLSPAGYYNKTSVDNKLLSETTIRASVDNNLQSQINGLASGSPLVASSVSEMTDTTRVYVNTTDGHWYYYNGSEWTDGGVYQGMEIGGYSIEGRKIKNDTITPRKLSEVNDVAWFNSFRFCEELYHNKIYSGGVLVDYDTTPVTSTGLVRITPGSKILVKSSIASPARLLLFDISKNYISQLAFNNIGIVPSNAYYMAASISTDDLDDIYDITCSLGVKSVNIPWLNINEEQITSSSKKTLKGLVFGDSLWSNCRGILNYPDAPYNSDQSGVQCVGYEQYLENAILPNYSIDITNYAQSGWGTVQWYRETTSQYCIQNITSEFLSDFDFCILAFGTNDATSGEQIGSLGLSGDGVSDYNDLTFIGAYRHCIDILLSLKPSLKIILWTPIPKIRYIGESNYYGVDTPNINGVTFKEFIQAIKDIGQLYSLPVVDLFSNVNLNKFNINDFTFEGVHLTNFGYAKIKDYFVNETIKYLDSK